MRLQLKPALCVSVVVACLGAGGCSSEAETQAPAASGVTAFEGARLITGDGSSPIAKSVFIVEKNQFVAVGRLGEVSVPAGATRVDLTGKTVMPAKVDMHGHLGFEDVVDGTTSGENFTRENLIDHLERFAYMGYSAVVSIADRVEREVMPGDTWDVFQKEGRLDADQKKRQMMGEKLAGKRAGVPAVGTRWPWGNVPLQVRDEVIPNAALFRTAGPAISWPGAGAQGHMSRNVIPYGVTTVDEARRAVQDYAKMKPQFIKIWMDAREEDGGGNPTLRTMPQPVYEAVIDEARKHGLYVSAHTVTLQDAKGLYRAGLVGSVHAPVRDNNPMYGDEELLAIIRERAAKAGDQPLWFVEPGVTGAIGPEAFNDPLLSEMLSPDQVERLRAPVKNRTPESIAKAREQGKAKSDEARKLIDAGMVLVFGSDNGSAGRGFGWMEQMKAESWVTGGNFTPMEAIVMWTSNGARVAKINTGKVEAGRSADFIVLDANPLDDIANTRRINRVYLRRAEVDRAGLRSKWQAQWSRRTSTQQ